MRVPAPASGGTSPPASTATFSIFSRCATREAIDAYAEAAKFTNTPPVETPEQIQDRSARRAERSAEADHEARRKSQAARNLWNHRLAIDELQGTPVDLYLAGRGIQGASRWESLRFHPSAWLQAGDARHELPAMVAAVSDNEGKVQAVHRTFLEKDGETWDKASRLTGKPRWMLGPTLGYGVRFGTLRDDGVLVVGEGIETVLSVLEFRSELPGVACGSAAHLAGFEPPEETRRLFIAADRGEAGMNAADQLQERCKERGIEVIVAPPPEGMNDWNDALQELGREETKAALDQSLNRFIDRTRTQGSPTRSLADTVTRYCESFARYEEERATMVGMLGAEPHARHLERRQLLAEMIPELESAAAAILATPEESAQQLQGAPILVEDIQAHCQEIYWPELKKEQQRQLQQTREQNQEMEKGLERPSGLPSALPPKDLKAAVEKYADKFARYEEERKEMIGMIGAEPHAKTLERQERLAKDVPKLEFAAASILAAPEEAAQQLQDTQISVEDIENHCREVYWPEMKKEKRRQRQQVRERKVGADQSWNM